MVGNFPPGWAEWNDRYRDGLRGFWRGDDGRLGDMAQRLTGSQDLYEWSGKRPNASINFVTAHDGFTLHDLVSYNEKHNEANGEDNRDGSDRNLSWNCGAEGPSDDPAINALREQQKRNLLATLLLSTGVPMLLAGDERGNSQAGNNNVYCQDNETGWTDWTETPERLALFAFVSRLIALRRDHPIFRRRNFFTGKPIEGDPIRDIGWMKPDGSEMQVDDWATHRALAMLVSGHGIAERGRRGERLFDDDFLLLVNAHPEPVEIVLPHGEPQWRLVVDTAEESPAVGAQDRIWAAQGYYPLQGRSLALLRRTRPPP
jgi:glycogen operon protein